MEIMDPHSKFLTPKLLGKITKDPSPNVYTVHCGVAIAFKAYTMSPPAKNAQLYVPGTIATLLRK